MLQQLKAFDQTTKDRASLDELVAMLVFATMMHDTYESLDLESPEWLLNTLGEIDVVVQRRRADKLATELAQAEAELAGTRTAAERRADAQAKVDRLRKKISSGNRT